MSNFEVTMGTGSLCMDNALRNALAVEVCNEIDVMKVCSLHAPFVKISVQTLQTHSNHIQGGGLMHRKFRNSINDESRLKHC